MWRDDRKGCIRSATLGKAQASLAFTLTCTNVVPYKVRASSFAYAMLLMTLLIVAVLVAGYLLMSTIRVSHLNRGAVAMFSGVIVWLLYMFHGEGFLALVHPGEYADYLAEGATDGGIMGFVAKHVLAGYIAEACSVILFLIATNTILEVMSNNGVFDALTHWLRMRHSRLFLWLLTLITFFVSANVDNLTTVVLMLMIVGKIVANHRQKVLFSCAVLVAAHLGGAFTVIGDMTSLMLWVRGVVTASAFAKGLFLPCLLSLCAFNLSLMPMLHGRLEVTSRLNTYRGDDNALAPWQKITMLFVGIAGLWSIPTFSAVTHFPPFIGALCVLALLWVVESAFTFRLNGNRLFVQRAYIKNTEFIGMNIIIYFLGISLGIGALKECGALDAVAQLLGQYIHNIYAYGLLTGVASAVFDTVPMMMAGLNLFPLDESGQLPDFALNGAYWQMLAYCSAIGSCLIYVTTLAGQAMADTERVRLSWYMRHIAPRVAVAWAVGMGTFWLIH